MLTKGIAHVSIAFLIALNNQTFNFPIMHNGKVTVSLSWLVRTGHIFNIASIWLKQNKGIDYSSILMQNDFVKEGIMTQKPFNGSNGRLLSTKSFEFIKRRATNVTSMDLQAMYGSISQIIKDWDNWYHSGGFSGTLERTVDMIVPRTPDQQAYIMYDNPRFTVGDDPSKNFVIQKTLAIGDTAVIDLIKTRSLVSSYGPAKDEYFGLLNDMTAATPVVNTTKERAFDPSVMNKVTRPVTLDDATAFGNAMLGIKGGYQPAETVRSAPLTAESVKKLNEKQKADIFIKGQQNLPILSWLNSKWEGE